MVNYGWGENETDKGEHMNNSEMCEMYAISAMVALLSTIIFAAFVSLIGLFPTLCLVTFTRNFGSSFKLQKEEYCKKKAREWLAKTRENQ